MLEIKYHNNVFISLTSRNNELVDKLVHRFTHHYKTWVKNKLVNKSYKFLYNDKYLYKGLLSELIDFCVSSDIPFTIDERLRTRNKLTDEKYEQLINIINPKFKPREYQKESIIQVIRDKQHNILSCTSSGKSLIAYVLIMFHKLTRKDKSKKSLLIVPTKNLVYQMYGDFIDYAETNDKINVEKIARKLTGDEEKFQDFEQDCLITTWQSLKNKPSEFLDQFEMCIVDEAHNSKAPVLSKQILEKCNAEYRIGLTGTFPDEELSNITIRGLLGDLVYSVSQRELIDMGFATDINILALILNYPMLYQKMNYVDEGIYVLEKEKRKEIITNMVKQYNNKNVMILFKTLQYGKGLVRMFKKQYPDRKVMYIDGSISTEERTEIKKYIENNNNCICVFSYRTMSTGESIKNLHVGIFAEGSGKQKFTSIQSIGRFMRQHSSKEKAIIIDIVDCINYNNEYNPYGYFYNHYIKRKDYYLKEEHPVKEIIINF